MKYAQPRQRGYALLMALVVLALAVVSLAALARRSTVAALGAQGAAEDLKRRWAVASCRDALLGQAETVLDEAERGGPADGPYHNAPTAELRVRCELAGIEYELIFTDEQAKLNPNSLLGSRKVAGTAAVVSRLSGVSMASGGREMSVKLRTLPLSSDASAQPLPAIGGYGQVFENASPELLAGDTWHGGAAGSVTCWSDGRVSVRRAPDAVILAACDKQVESRLVRALLAARKKDPYADLATMTAGAGGIDEAGAMKLAQFVTDRSSCHGLWVIARTPARSWYAFSACKGKGGGAAARAAGSAGRGRRYDFQW